jgi:hypothetical protein
LWLEELGELKKFSHLIGNRTCDLPAYIMVSQPTSEEKKNFVPVCENVFLKHKLTWAVISVSGFV